MILSTLNKSDVDSIVALYQGNFSDGWNKNMLESAFDGGRFIAIGAFEEDKLIGAITCSVSFEDADIEGVVLSIGGSLGARRINESMLKVMLNLTSKRPSVMHFHACGRRDLAYSQKSFAECGLEGKKNLVLSEFFYNF